MVTMVDGGQGFAATSDLSEAVLAAAFERAHAPEQRHDGHHQAILAARHALYLKARERNPARWSGATRDWTPTRPVTLNPERDSVVAAHSTADDRQPQTA
jgi:hypothetical protein